MAQLLVRNIDPDMLADLKKRAKLHHRSLQGEVISILEEAANAPTHKSSWSPEILKRVIGKWQGGELTRSEPGHYEKRDELK